MEVEILQSVLALIVFSTALMSSSYCTSRLNIVIHFVYSGFFHGIIALLWVSFAFSVLFVSVSQNILVLSLIMGFLVKTVLNIKRIHIFPSLYKNIKNNKAI